MSGYHSRRNRSVRTLTKDTLSQLLKSSSAAGCEEEKKDIINKKCISKGNEVYNSVYKSSNFLSNCELTEVGSQKSVSATTDSESSITIRLSGLSSTSSLSWSDEYESGVTKKVQDQLEKLDKVFLGLEEVPNIYDKEEIEEWRWFFPNLCILGNKTPLNSPQHSESDSDSVSEYCDTKYSDDCTSKNNPSSMSVKCLISHDSPTVKKRWVKNKSLFVKNEDSFYAKGKSVFKHKQYITPPKMQNLEIDNYLKISPIKSSKQNERRRKPIPHLNKQVVSCEADIGGSTEYTSLPFINPTTYSSNSNRKSRIASNTKKSTEKLILPPITNQFRSISATPRHTISSSFSVFGTNVKQQKRSQLMSFVENVPLTNR